MGLNRLAKNSVKTKHINPGSVTPDTLSQDVKTANKHIQNMLAVSLFSTKEKKYLTVSDTNSVGPTTGFAKDISGYFSTTYDAAADSISIVQSETLSTDFRTANQLFVNKADTDKIKNAGGCIFSFSLETAMTLSTITWEVYSVKASSFSLIHTVDIARNPQVNTVLNAELYFDAKKIPVNTEALWFYIKISGYTSGTKLLKIYDFSSSIPSLTVPSANKEKTIAKIKKELGVDTAQNDIVSNIQRISDIETSLRNSILKLSDVSTTKLDVTLSNDGILSSVGKSGVTGTHLGVFFPESNQEVTFTHTRKDDWILIGGDENGFSAIGIDYWNIRIADLGGASITTVDKTIDEKPNVGDRINLKWKGSVIEAKRDKLDGTGFNSWFTVDLSLYPQIKNYINKKRFGAVALGTTSQTLMKNVSFEVLGVLNVANELYTLKTQIQTGSNSWSGKKVNFVGDSITAANKYPPIIASQLNINPINYGMSSSTVAVNNAYLQGKSFCERVLTMSDADLWAILGGVNDHFYLTPLGTIDSTDQTTFYGGYKSLVENILNRSNNPKILLMTPLQSNRNGSNSIGLKMMDYCNAIKEIGQYYSIPVLDMYSIGGISAFNLSKYTSDGVHPTDAGTNIYAPKLTKAIRDLV